MVCAAARFENGAHGTIDATTAAYPGFLERIEIACERGTAGLAGTELLVQYQDGRREHIAPDDSAGGTGADPMAFPHDYHRSVMADFIDALETGREPRVTGEEALRVHRLIDALIETGATGRPVRVSSDRGMTETLRFAAIGLDHRHIYHLVGELIAAGAECAGYCPLTSDPRVLEGFRERFPDLKPVDRDRLFDDPTVNIVCSAAIPKDRPQIAIRAMRAGKDVMVDKPGAITLDQVDEIEATARATGRIFSICFSERFVVRACVAAARLVAEGAIGRVIETVGLGRTGSTARSGRAGSSSRRPMAASSPTSPRTRSTSSCSHRREGCRGCRQRHRQPRACQCSSLRGLWRDPAARRSRLRLHPRRLVHARRARHLGRRQVVPAGTEGFIELRKYTDLAGRKGGDHLFLSNRDGTRHIDASGEQLTYFARFPDDVRSRGESAMPDGHALQVTRLAIKAQNGASRIGAGAGKGSA